MLVIVKIKINNAIQGHSVKLFITFAAPSDQVEYLTTDK